MAIAALVVQAACPCLAHEEAVIVAGRTGAGQLVADADFDQPVGLQPSIFPGIPGYATGELAFHSTILDDPADDFFQLSNGGADIRFVLLAKDPGIEVWNDTGSAFMQVNDRFFIGSAPFDVHPIWNLVSGTPGHAASLTLKLIDLKHVYSDSEPFVLSFTPATAQPTLASTTSLSASATTLSAGQPLTLTATVAPGPAATVPSGTVPSGDVTFFDGPKSLGAVALNGAGIATFSSASLAVGTHTLTASYDGSATFGASISTARVVQVAAAPDFSIGASAASVTVAAGQAATTTLTITPLNGSTQTVSVGCGTMPPFASCAFSPSAAVTLNGSQPATVTLTIRTNVVAALPQRAAAPAWASAGGLLGLTWLLSGLRTRLSGLRTRHSRRHGILLMLCLGLVACGGGGGGSSSSASSQAAAVTPPGTYTLAVSAAAGATSHPLTLTVVVQ